MKFEVETCPEALPVLVLRRGSSKTRVVARHLALPLVAGMFLTLLLLLVTGCANTSAQHRTGAFDFNKDTFAYPNELLWEYAFDTNGQWKSHAPEKRKQKQYALRCFVVARSAAQFYKFARFEPDGKVADEETYRRLIRKVVAKYPSHLIAEKDRIIIPGYADLRAFSEAHEALLKAECGGMLQSYFQRGHWRMIFPFTRDQQRRTAARLVESIHAEDIAVVHLVSFPSLTINHAVLLFEARDEGNLIRFATYDPNDSCEPTTLSFDKKSSQFHLPTNKYFPGGPLKVYQVYHRWNY